MSVSNDSRLSDTNFSKSDSFTGDNSSGSYESRQVHINNLYKIVEYCENVIDCRRSLQLNYFAEQFSREQCLANRDMACDNCLKRDCFKVIWLLFVSNV